MKRFLLQNYNLEKVAVIVGLSLGFLLILFNSKNVQNEYFRFNLAETSVVSKKINEYLEVNKNFYKCENSSTSKQCSSLCGKDNSEKDLAAKLAQEEEIKQKVAGASTENQAAQKAIALKVAKPVLAVPATVKKSPVSGILFTDDPNRMSCHLKGKNHPSKSATKKQHYDEDCCIDLDEWLKPGCVYLFSDFNVSLNSKKTTPANKSKK
jgi:hypothetical protein